MALSIGRDMTLRLFSSLFGMKTNRNFLGKGNLFFFSGNRSLGFGTDSFLSNAQSQTLKLTVEKVQSAASRATSAAVPVQPNRSIGATTVDAPAPTQQEIGEAVDKAGGAETIAPWLVDGRTKLDINGRKVVAAVNPSAAPAASGTTGAANADAAVAKTAEQLREEAAASLARFGLGADTLNRGGDVVRERLKTAAAENVRQDSRLSLAVEYALEDAYAKVHAWEGAASGAAPSPSYEQRREANLQQADSIGKQLNLGDGDIWGVQSLAEDLAVFGLDFASLSGDPYDLAETVRTKSREMQDDLQTRYVGTEAEFFQERNRITGASARLVNGLESSAGTFLQASLSTSFSRVDVSVNGAQISGTAVIAISNVITDPLVLDLNGDGIDLKSADEGIAFDMNGDGVKTDMGFIRGDDAFLFIDSHGDGLVHDGGQLFGNSDGYANGFEKLRAYDENGDGVIDENDAIYDKLFVWQEQIENGVVDEGETMSLRQAGIRSINLGYDNVRVDDGKGNLIGQIGGFTRDDGSQGTVADVWLQEKRDSAGK